MMSMENLSLIMIALVAAVAAAGAAYVGLRIWAARMVASDHPRPGTPDARAARATLARPLAASAPVLASADLEPRQ